MPEKTIVDVYDDYFRERSRLSMSLIHNKNGKHIQVSCAIIEREGLVLAAQRSASMSMPLKWEFPGGKVDNGESLEECLRRELVEEMSIIVQVKKKLPESTHDYPTFTITLHPFVCSMESEKIHLHEHAAISWLPPAKLHTLDWAKADLSVIDAYLSECNVCSK